MSLKKLFLSTFIIITSLYIVACFDNSSEPNPTPPNKSLTKYINPFIGTGFHGHTFPGAVVPEGMIQISPVTPNKKAVGIEARHWDLSSGYHFDNPYFAGYALTALSGTGIEGLNDIRVLPYVDENNSKVGELDKKTEKASVGYYSVNLKSGIQTEVTASERTGKQHFVFPENAKEQHISIGMDKLGSWNINSEIVKVDDSTLHIFQDSYQFSSTMQNHKLYAILKFDRPIQNINFEKLVSDQIETVKQNDTDAFKGSEIFANLTFDSADSNELTVTAAISFTDIEGAKNNLESEGGIAFSGMHQNAISKWEEAIKDFKVEGGSESDKITFYTALYHTKLAPHIFQDVDGRYRKMTNNAQPVENDIMPVDSPVFSIYSLWDTHRALHPLKTITEPERAVEYAKDLIRKYDEGGILPKWEFDGGYTGIMVGYPAVSIIADAMSKFPERFTMEEREHALKAAMNSATYHKEDFSNIGWNGGAIDGLQHQAIDYVDDQECLSSDKCGWVPAEGEGQPEGVKESVSYGLEMAFYDKAISRIAALAGDNAAKVQFEIRSHFWKKYWNNDPSFLTDYGMTGFMVPRYQDGSFEIPFNPYNINSDGESHDNGNYTEGTAWQWTWFVPHDIDGLKTTMGGIQAFTNNLNKAFTDTTDGNQSNDMTGMIGQVAFGNEPSHHTPYLYNWSAEPWKTQEIIDQIEREFYGNKPENIIGNEDVGAMSAWYVMSALGFYQVDSSNPIYTIGRPIFDEATIPVKNGAFRVVAENNSPDAKYVRSVTINGQPLGKNFTFAHREFKPGGELRFVLTNNKEEALQNPTL
ncbi:GH92 family glycosyl hydrolase [Vibrio mimicus]